MGKPFYEFGDREFRDELTESYIIPVARWLLGDPSSAYLLPQASGSNWECALATEFLLGLYEDGELDSSMSVQVRDKCLNTIRWMLSKLVWMDGERCNWDGVTWDTAVCTRVLLHAESFFHDRLSAEEQREVARSLAGAVRWLVEKSDDWDSDIRYPAGPPDLAQVLNTLVLVAAQSPQLLTQAEKSGNLTAGSSSIDHIARVLLAMEERSAIETDDGRVELSFWVDCFDSSEVLEGLGAYLQHCKRPGRLGNASYEAHARDAVIRCLRYLELNQSDGMWRGVADTCGTLYGYLKVVGTIEDIEPEDHVVFKALRWMCDEKQALADGSFLHTTYVTVFYALALREATCSWPLSKRSGGEVYDIALWSGEVRTTAERSKRLELQIALEDAGRRLEEQDAALNRWATTSAAVAIFFVQLILVLLGVLAFGVVVVEWQSLNFNLVKPEIFWTILGVGVPAAISVTGAVLAIRRKNRQQLGAES
jgi:hypothetical protein